MPHFLRWLGYVGTAAMLWVGAKIIAHDLPFTAQLLHDLEQGLATMPVVPWFAKALECGVAGLIVGFIMEKLVGLVKTVFF